MSGAAYLYAIVRAAEVPDLTGLRAVAPDAPVRAIRVGGLAAVVSTVDVVRFAVDTEEYLRAPDLLEQRVEAHERVVEALLGDGAVLPMRFSTVLPDDDAVVALLRANGGDLDAGLADVAGRHEWGVRLHCDLGALAETLAPGDDDAPAPPATGGAGRNYLLAKARAQTRARAADERARQLASETHRALAAVADASEVLAPRRGAGDPAILNGAYLVAHGERDRFMERIAAVDTVLGPSGAFTFEVTGPWPPYTFTQVRIDG